MTFTHSNSRTLTANIRLRRGSKVSINVPIFHDKLTPRPFREPVPPCLRNITSSLPHVKANACSDATSNDTSESGDVGSQTLPDLLADAKEDCIYMDAMCFGMGCSCLQVTFQACSVEEARRLYDQLAVVAPIMVSIHELSLHMTTKTFQSVQSLI